MATATFERIAQDELSSRVKRGDRIQIINVLEPQHYALGMIPGSLRIPVSQIRDRIDELDKSIDVVTYCAGPECPASRQAAEILGQAGFRVQAYEGGIKEWKEAGLPTEGSAA